MILLVKGEPLGGWKGLSTGPICIGVRASGAGGGGGGLQPPNFYENQSIRAKTVFSFGQNHLTGLARKSCMVVSPYRFP